MTRQIQHRFAEALTPWGRRSFYSDVLAQGSRLIILSGGSPRYVSEVLLHLLADNPAENFEVYHAIGSPMDIAGVFSPERRLNIIPNAIIDQDIMGSLPSTVHRVELHCPVAVWPRVSYRTTRLLAMAKYAHDEMAERIRPYTMGESMTSVRQLLLTMVPKPSLGDKGSKIRHYFGGSLTPYGWVDFLEADFHDVDRTIYFQGTFGLDHTSLIRWFGEQIALAGYDANFYHCELDSSQVDHVVAPSLKLGATLATAPHALAPRPSDIVIDMREWLTPHHEDLLPLLNIYQTGINQALARLSKDNRSIVPPSTNPGGFAQDVKMIKRVFNGTLILS